MFFVWFQQNEAKLDEILKELKSIKDTISNQDERISKLEQQMAKMTVWEEREQNFKLEQGWGGTATQEDIPFQKFVKQQRAAFQ